MENNEIIKAPDGMTIEKPEHKKEFSAPSVDPNLPQILYPHYINNAHTELKCILKFPDGRIVEEHVKKGEGPLAQDIFKFFSEKEVLDNTNKETKRLNALQEQVDRDRTEEMRKKKQKDIWDTKSGLLDLDIIKNTKHKELKRGIRKARTAVEALAYGAAIVIKETEL